MLREGYRDRHYFRDQQANVSHLMLTEGHALAGGNGRDTSKLLKFFLFLRRTHANELMYINYAYCISLLYMIGNMKNQGIQESIALLMLKVKAQEDTPRILP